MVGLVQTLTWLALSVVACATPYALDERASPVPPTDDAFYAVPQDGLRETAPGTILRHRTPPAPIAAFGVAPIKLKTVHQMLYRTTDNLGDATATVVTVLVPHNADYGKVLSYQVAQDSAFLNCAPSYAFQLASASGGTLGTVVTQAEILLIEASLEQGWVVIVPDFEGPQAAYMANRLAGQATLDGIRAALNSADLTGIKKDATIAMWGYSGGSVASGWAAELQPTYAPELKIAGAALGGTVPNITTVIGEINKTLFAGVIPAGIVGLANQYPSIAEAVQKHVLPKYRPLFEKVKSQCVVADVLDFFFKDVTAMLDDPSIPFTDPEIVSILADNALGHAVPKIPLFVYKSIGDELSPISETDSLVKKYCARGASVQYQRDLISEHGALAVTAAPKALAWIRDVMNGMKPQAGCTTKSVASSLLDPATLEIMPGFILHAFLDLLGKPVGPILIG